MTSPVLTSSERYNIARELVAVAGVGNPEHKTLHRDIDRAYFLAASSSAFRSIVAEIPNPKGSQITVYVAGPMTGIPEHNVPAFDRAAAALRGQGFAVVTPPDITRSLGRYVEGIGDDGTITEAAYRFLVRHDFRALLECDAMAMLPGWRRSKGAKSEYLVGVQLGIPIYTAAGLIAGRCDLPFGDLGHGHAVVTILTVDDE